MNSDFPPEWVQNRDDKFSWGCFPYSAISRTKVYIVTFHLHRCGFCLIVSWGFSLTMRNVSVISEDVIFQRTVLTWKSFT